jgi:hypothetical protein
LKQTALAGACFTGDAEAHACLYIEVDVDQEGFTIYLFADLLRREQGHAPKLARMQ